MKTLTALLMAIAPVLACGPFFPSSVLQGGDGALLSPYFTSFQLELDRIRLPSVECKAVVSTNSAASQTFDAEVAELREAGSAAGMSPSAANRLLREFQIVREKLRVHAEAVEDWKRQNLFHGPGDAFPPRPRISRLEVPAGLPGEFGEYLAGSIAFHSGDTNAARAAWERLLIRPAAQRQYRSTWAAFMLGKIWLDADAGKSARLFQQTRDLAKAGFKDALGLAAASYGWEAKAALLHGDRAAAIRLYLQQYQAGDPSAALSLRIVMRQILEPPRAGLLNLAADPLAQQVVTAYLISMRSFNDADSLDDTNQIIERWLQAVEHTEFKPAPSADRLALAAYQRGLFEVAERWLARAEETSAMAQWLRAKFHLRAGKVDEAAKLLSQVIRLFPREGDWPVPPVRADEWDTDSPVRTAMGELGALRLARRQYYEALDTLLHAGYWSDAAYVAEYVLTPDELAAYVERQWPELEGEPESSEVALEPRFDSQGELRPEATLVRIRYLAARRLARLQRWDEAFAFYPARWKPRLAEFVQSWERGRDPGLNAEARAQALWEAAQIARHEGMELFGTEVEPDWTLFEGQYDWSHTSELRRNHPYDERSYLYPSGPRPWNAELKLVVSTPDEQRRIQDHAPKPNRRFHYRYLAADLAWEAAELMPDNTDATARVLWTAGTWLKTRDPQSADPFYKALVRRCGLTALGQEADRLRWFPKTADAEPAPDAPDTGLIEGGGPH